MALSHLYYKTSRIPVSWYRNLEKVEENMGDKIEDLFLCNSSPGSTNANFSFSSVLEEVASEPHHTRVVVGTIMVDHDAVFRIQYPIFFVTGEKKTHKTTVCSYVNIQWEQLRKCFLLNPPLQRGNFT